MVDEVKHSNQAAVIFSCQLVENNACWNQSFDFAEAAHSTRFLSNPSK